jgi:hypothetical protein
MLSWWPAQARRRPVYNKIRFCVERAAKDGLDYAWVDTCCIDKSTSDELSTAINSMFRWYQRASKCYVYLSDVQMPDEVIDVQTFRMTWDGAFVVVDGLVEDGRFKSF